jgi:TonB family protein
MGMPLRSLVFSSDRGTAHLLGEALAELSMEVEHCPEIFGAIERLTLQSFDVLVVDWSDEPEASFLLKSARELKSHEPPFPVAVVEVQNSIHEAQRAGANRVLIKSRARFDLLQIPTSTASRPKGVTNVARPAVKPAPPEIVDGEFSTNAGASYLQPELNLTLGGYASPTHTKRPPAPPGKLRPKATQARAYKNALGFFALVVAVFVSVAGLGPLVNSAFPAAVTQAVLEKMKDAPAWAFQTMHQWLAPSPSSEDRVSEPPEYITVTANRQARRPALVKPSPFPLMPDPADLPVRLDIPVLADLQPAPLTLVTGTENAPVPESLRHPPDSVSVRTVVANLTPTLLGALEPVLIPEEVSRKLLLQKIQPNYPEQALRAGLQGPVVLQAWIGRDGKIRDLKLVRGYMVLGRAAFDAVRQWRFQPYYRNGHPMETETYITVNFTPDAPAEQAQ